MHRINIKLHLKFFFAFVAIAVVLILNIIIITEEPFDILDSYLYGTFFRSTETVFAGCHPWHHPPSSQCVRIHNTYQSINQFNSNLAAREPDRKWYAVEIIDNITHLWFFLVLHLHQLCLQHPVFTFLLKSTQSIMQTHDLSRNNRRSFIFHNKWFIIR